MKHISIVLLTSLLLLSCTQYVQVFEMSSENLAKQNGFVFENDTVKVEYNFWAERGRMAFVVTNKLDIPLYIDWKRSSFIVNNQKFDYWQEEEEINTKSAYGGYFLYNPTLVEYNSGIVYASSSIVKIERYTFLPPRSEYGRSQFILMKQRRYKFSDDVQEERKLSYKSPSDSMSFYSVNISKEKSPLVHRNFLALSTIEGGDDNFYLDHEFYLSGVQEMERDEFGEVQEKENKMVRVPYEPSASGFYLYIPRKLSNR